MSKKPVDTLSTLNRGFAAATKELKKRGAKSILTKRALNRKTLSLINKKGRKLTLIVKSRTSGTWQGTTKDGDMNKVRLDTCWLFVDLSQRKPDFYVVPDDTMRRDIKRVHSKYLTQKGGKRPRNPDSTHHAIELYRISKWKDNWQLLGL